MRGAGADQELFRSRRIEQLAPRDLREQAGNSGRAEDETDVLLRPSSIAQKHRHERSKAGQDGRHEEVDAIESPLAAEGR